MAEIDLKKRSPKKAKEIKEGFSPEGRAAHRKKRLDSMLESIRAELPWNKKKDDEDEGE